MNAFCSSFSGLFVWASVLISFGFYGTATADAPVELKLFPSKVDLSTKADAQRVILQAVFSDGTTRDVTSEATYSLVSQNSARLTNATLYPLADGETTLLAQYGNVTSTAPVRVQQAATDRPLSFKLDVMPVFTKAGCNSGACHGSSRGKDGFRLSLLGFDPEGDHQRLTRELVGRRVNLALPAESLILQKGLGAVQHTGGERFKTNSELYTTLLTWVEAGAPKDGTNVAQVTGVEIFPRDAVLPPSGTQRFIVHATYSDGTDRDVSSLAAFFSNNDAAAKVSDAGLVSALTPGEAFITARFDAYTVGAQISVVPTNRAFVWPADIKEGNYIDALVHKKLKKLRIVPSPVTDDTNFMRRASLDLTGSVPSPESLHAFLQDTNTDKRSRLIEGLLQKPDFADLWVMKWAELLQIRSRENQVSYKAALKYFDWLRTRLITNAPLDQVVRELITASGSTLQNPAANYYQIETDTLKSAENTAQVFLGMRIQCAQCHNHPFDRWTMNDYYGFAGFFAQVGRKPGEDPRETIIFDNNSGDAKHPVSGQAVAPKFLGGPTPPLTNGTRRAALAQWLTAPENPYFARNLANLVWAHFFGRGIIEPVDDVRISNPASNPELLDTLATNLVASKYDLRRLVRDICNSRTYQLSTRTNESNAGDTRNFARGPIRRLRAEVLLDVIARVTEAPEKFPGLPRGARAVQLADGNTSTYFLTTFGRANRETVCSCEVKMEPNLSQALHLLNGDTVNQKIQEGGLIPKLIKAGKSPQDVVTVLYWRALGRAVTPAELTHINQHLQQSKTPEPVLSDVFWALLNSKEFVFNH